MLTDFETRKEFTILNGPKEGDLSMCIVRSLGKKFRFDVKFCCRDNVSGREYILEMNVLKTPKDDQLVWDGKYIILRGYKPNCILRYDPRKQKGEGYFLN